MNRPRILVGVLSAQPYKARRGGVLATWGRDVDSRPEQLELVFLIGDPQRKLPRREGRMLYLPCPDDYPSLTQKTRWFCLWALAHGGPWDLLFKCDDDTYVRVDRLLQGDWKSPIVGCADGDGQHFHGGAGYVISREAALSIAARLTAPTGLEDWKARDAIAEGGMWFAHDDRLCFDLRRIPQPANEQITCHYASPLKMRLIHDTFWPAAEDRPPIPRILHHIWLGGPLPARYQRFRESWRAHHPGWQLKLWTDDNLPRLQNQTWFDKAPTRAQQSHLARYEILHREGGIYVDCDVECQRPLDGLLGPQGLAAAEDPETVGVAVLACRPGDKLMEGVIRALPAALERHADLSLQSGSRFFTPHLLAEPSWRLYGWQTFYPRHRSGRDSARLQEAYAVHHWESSWKQ